MHITVAGKQVETGEALKTHVREGLSTIARKYFDRAVEANVTFRRDRAFFACDINLKAGRGLLLRSEGEGPDAHRAFDEAAQHLAKRMRRHRRRFNEHARSLAAERAEAAPIEEEEALAGRRYVLREEEEEEADTAAEARPDGGGGDGADYGAIVAEHPERIDRLTVGEAVMRMDLSNVPVLMFRNRASGELNVVYRRPDGHVGWIDPGAA